MARRLTTATSLHRAADAAADVIARLLPGEGFELLDDTGGWAWGYAGPDRRVGYVRSEALGI